MIIKRINTDLFLNLFFKEIISQSPLNYNGALGMKLEIKKVNSSIWREQDYTLTDDGIIHFQWNSEENNSLGTYDAKLSYYKISGISETGKLSYVYDAISLFKIVPTSVAENTTTDTSNTIDVLVSWGGADGMSAYDIAVKHGYTGTEADFANIEINNAENELERVSSEILRAQQENSRNLNEIARVGNESSRISAENARVADFNNIKEEAAILFETSVFYSLS